MRSDTARNRRADPLAETIAELKLPALGDEALFLWNMFFDPREILDLVDTVRLSPSEAADRLTATLRGALTGWAKQVPRKQASTRHAGPRPPAVSPGRAAAPARRDRRRSVVAVVVLRRARAAESLLVGGVSLAQSWRAQRTD